MKYLQRIAFAAAAVGALAWLASGCSEQGGRERDTGPDEERYSLTLDASGALARVSGVGGAYDIYSVDPNQGLLAGGESVTLTGVFPAGAQGMYTVYFGTNVAPYDSMVPFVMLATGVYVTAPPGVAPGLVDVMLRENATQLDAAALYYGYEYLDPFAIIDAVPDAGPIVGGQQVTILGRFPIAAPITTIAAAYAAYQAYFDGLPAGFDASFNPIITSEAMYVLTPPHPAGVVNVSVATVEDTPRFRVLVDGYEYLAPLDVIEVDPDRGWIFGFEQVTIRGTFPVTTAFSNSLTAISAANYYYVQFGNRIAQFDPFVLHPVITATEMYVLSPPGEDVGFVDVSVGAFDDVGNVVTVDTLAQAYRYYAMYLLRTVPNQGPLSGGNEVRLEGIFPGTASINDIYAVDAIYSAYFAYNLAPFVGPPLQPTPSPVFFPSQIDTINQTYTIGYMYVTAPAGPAPGFVDVSVEDDTGRDLTTICPDCYEYIDDTQGIARWDNAIVLPNPVGKLLAGELRVIIEGLGSVDQSIAGATGPAFIVPQGGDPDNVDHRILLEQTSYSESGQFFTWEGTNVEAIPRIMNQGASDELLVDGHAAVYLEVENNEIFGDSLDPTDGGVIQVAAQEGRHFLIDTIPPRLLAYGIGVLRGDDLVSTDVLTGDYTTTVGNIPVSPLHPYPLPVGGEHPSTGVDAPFDGNTLIRPPLDGRVAQMFFNVASISNLFVEENLQIFIDNVVFEDVDIYTMLGRAANPASDTNFFVPGSTVRQQAGFRNQADLPTTLVDLPRDEAFITNPDLLTSGQFQSSPFSLPEMTGIDVEYESVAGVLTLDGGGASLSPNLALTPARMIARYRVGDVADLSTGVDVSNAGPISLIPIVFRAVDRAGDYSPRGDTSIEKKKLWTINDRTAEGYVPAQQPDMGPLNLWWLRATGTRIVSTVPSNGDARDPSFSWEPTLGPVPPGQFDNTLFEGSERLYNFAIYWTGANRGFSRDEQRDGPYEMILPWQGWSSTAEITDVDSLLSGVIADPALREGVWFLLVVMSVDEAGNVELWPVDLNPNDANGDRTQLDIRLVPVDGSSTSPSRIDEVFEPGDEERNWERWYVPPRTETVETIVEAFFWHDTAGGGVVTGAFDAGENSFGNAEVIPYPIPARFNPQLGVPSVTVVGERVAAQFRVTLITDDADATINWSITENGDQIATETDVPQNPDGSFIVNVILPDAINPNGFLGSANRQPTYYTFQAQTVNSGTDGVVDSSPATVQFVVVDNVADFIRNPSETQPIRESDVN